MAGWWTFRPPLGSTTRNRRLTLNLTFEAKFGDNIFFASFKLKHEFCGEPSLTKSSYGEHIVTSEAKQRRAARFHGISLNSHRQSLTSLLVCSWMSWWLSKPYSRRGESKSGGQRWYFLPSSTTSSPDLQNSTRLPASSASLPRTLNWSTPT